MRWVWIFLYWSSFFYLICLINDVYLFFFLFIHTARWLWLILSIYYLWFILSVLSMILSALSMTFLWFDGLYSIYCLVDTDLSWVTFQAYKLFFCLFYKASKTIFLLVSTSFWQPLFHFFVFWPTLLVTFQAENFSFWQFSYFLFTGSRPPQ